jgi:hypothetical protein
LASENSYPYALNNLKKSATQTSSRGSKKAINKVSKMRKAYTMNNNNQTRSAINANDDQTVNLKISNNDSIFTDDDDPKDDFEDEAKNLYAWTQKLSTNDPYLKSPRF